ncbi:MAG: hypothetical protein GY941_15735 [Planctomycetes bacterium]|nr:hypothetical protein [Planctomycetota bacterium]
MSLLRKTRESTTLQILVVPLSLLCWKYATNDITSATEFANAFGVLMAVWLGREWRSAHYVDSKEAEK